MYNISDTDVYCYIKEVNQLHIHIFFLHLHFFPDEFQSTGYTPGKTFQMYLLYLKELHFGFQSIHVYMDLQ